MVLIPFKLVVKRVLVIYRLQVLKEMLWGEVLPGKHNLQKSFC